MMEIGDPDPDYIEKKLEYLQEMFCETVYEDIISGNKVNKEDIKEAIKYFSDKEEYEKCIILKNEIKKN